ncbi:MAG TPA: GNAT family N-acetyltransferase [Leptospiraceae bacterium]|nr:GNAT family N-acetyltransferase [Leptospiraceae bacterium]HMW07134.1 GNAT family N-acetyltransferase [Leptospiraceae bacterium]HMX31808.1 GNAT family N-acetyltransferase [Leptospiraceae bacterium]HMY32549.1 GNAT family N-acetyltransferase [Leptospiraceae bacterium]HMZ63917.1 GNAT family N-acetyltransferase [Leptospiraceae bacterium]
MQTEFKIINIDSKFRTQAIELVNQFFKQINAMKLDGVFKVKSKAASKMVDIYLKLQGTGKIVFIGAVLDDELVSLLIARIEERPHLEEDKILYIDLAVTKRGQMKKGYMHSLLDFTESWAKKKKIKVIELRALTENRDAVRFWSNRGYSDFYIRFRKLV